VAELAQHYGVAGNTVIKTLRRMADDGLVEIVPNWGNIARAELGQQARPPKEYETHRAVLGGRPIVCGRNSPPTGPVYHQPRTRRRSTHIRRFRHICVVD
jgi:hypothetical protein